jgi:hypothetical protein
MTFQGAVIRWAEWGNAVDTPVVRGTAKQKK